VDRSAKGGAARILTTEMGVCAHNELHRLMARFTQGGRSGPAIQEREMSSHHQPRQYKDGTRYWEKGHQFPVVFTRGVSDIAPEPAQEPELPRITVRFGVSGGECRLLVLDGESELERHTLPAESDWHGLLEAMRYAVGVREERGPAAFVFQSTCKALRRFAEYNRRMDRLRRAARIKGYELRYTSRADSVMAPVLQSEAMVAVVCEIWRHIFTLRNVEFEEGWE